MSISCTIGKPTQRSFYLDRVGRCCPSEWGSQIYCVGYITLRSSYTSNLTVSRFDTTGSIACLQSIRAHTDSWDRSCVGGDLCWFDFEIKVVRGWWCKWPQSSNLNPKLKTSTHYWFGVNCCHHGATNIHVDSTPWLGNFSSQLSFQLAWGLLSASTLHL